MLDALLKIKNGNDWIRSLTLAQDVALGLYRSSIHYYTRSNPIRNNNDPRAEPGCFIFGHSPYTTGRPHVGIGCLPARIVYLLPVNGSCGSNKLSWSVSLSTFSWFWI
jgi:hypothetical protein